MSVTYNFGPKEEFDKREGVMNSHRVNKNVAREILQSLPSDLDATDCLPEEGEAFVEVGAKFVGVANFLKADVFELDVNTEAVFNPSENLLSLLLRA